MLKAFCTNTSGSPLGLKEDSWAINHPRILEAMAQSSQTDVAHRGPSVDIHGKQITIWATEELDTTAAHSTLEPTNFAVYSGREDAANSRAKSYTVESVAVNPADKQQIIITLNDSTPVEEDSIIEIEYEYPGLSDANGRLLR